MAKVEITESLFIQIDTKFKQKSIEVLEHLKSLESSPHKGKALGTIGGIVIKELKYEGFQFYYPPRILRGLRPAVELALKHEMFFKRTIFLLLTDSSFEKSR